MSAFRMYSIPTDFWRLDPPMTDGEKLKMRQRSYTWQVEEIHVWNERLLVEQDKIQFCLEENIPTKVITHEFASRLEARIWAVRYTLEHRPMTEFWRYYLTGRLYIDLQEWEQKEPLDAIHPNKAKTAKLNMMADYDITSSTLGNYVFYARGIQRFIDSQEALAFKILQGEIQISLNNMRTIVRMKDELFQQLVQRFQEGGDLGNPSRVVAIIDEVEPTARQKKEKVASIKDMPEYDPDAEIMSLSLTLPIWTRQMERARNSSDFRKISKETAKSMEQGLVHHRTEIQHFIRMLRKAQYYGIE